MDVVDVIIGIGLFLLAIIDWKEKKIPVWMVVVWSVILFLIRWIEGISLLNFIVACLPGIILFILAISSRERIGIGDALVLCILGIVYTVEKVIAILGISLFIIAVWASVLLVLKKANRNTPLPFLPCLFIAYFLVHWIK